MAWILCGGTLAAVAAEKEVDKSCESRVISLHDARVARQKPQSVSPPSLLQEVRASGVPDWFRRFDQKSFHIGALNFGPALINGTVDSAFLDVDEFFERPTTLHVADARFAASNMTFWELGRWSDTAHHDHRVEELMRLWQSPVLEVEVSWNGPEVPVAYLAKLFYRKLFEIRNEDDHVAAAYARFFAILKQRLALIVNPERNPSGEAAREDRALSEARDELTRLIAGLSFKLNELRAMELSMGMAPPLWRTGFPHLSVDSLESVLKQRDLQEAISYIPQPIRLAFDVIDIPTVIHH